VLARGGRRHRLGWRPRQTWRAWPPPRSVPARCHSSGAQRARRSLPGLTELGPRVTSVSSANVRTHVRSAIQLRRGSHPTRRRPDPRVRPPGGSHPAGAAPTAGHAPGSQTAAGAPTTGHASGSHPATAAPTTGCTSGRRPRQGHAPFELESGGRRRRHGDGGAQCGRRPSRASAPRAPRPKPASAPARRCAAGLVPR
jgi:hypothetical protein